MSDSEPERSVSPDPILMYGMERSGTTLLSMMVGAHPDIAVPFAVAAIWYEFAERCSRDYGGLQSTEDRQRLIHDLLAHPRIRNWDAELDKDKIEAQLNGSDFAAIMGAFYRAYAAEKGKPRWGQMEIATLDDLPIAYEWFPSARFVHLVRDGRDVAVSHQTMPYGSGNIAECAQAWKRRLGTNLAIGQVLGRDQYHVIRYEDLVERPEPTLATLCDFIGVPYSDDMLNYPAMVDNKVPEERRWLWPDLNKKPNAEKLYRWRDKMTANQRAVFESYAGDLLKELSYETLATPPRGLAPHLLDLWYFLGRGGRFHRFAKRLGLNRKSTLERQAEKRGERVA